LEKRLVDNITAVGTYLLAAATGAIPAKDRFNKMAARETEPKNRGMLRTNASFSDIHPSPPPSTLLLIPWAGVPD
jgi:hypothetical protein